MKRKLTYLILAAASLLMTACHIYDDYMYGPDGEQKVKVSFVLALGSSDDPFTRAETWHPDDPTDDDNNIGYDPKAIGDSYDNMIDPGTLQVVFYENTDEGRFVGSVTIRDYYPVDEEGNRISVDAEGYMLEDKVSNLYHFDGTLMADEGVLVAGTPYKIAVYANMPQSQRQLVTAGGSLSELSDNLKFTRFAYEGVAKDTEFIPMWGVKAASLDLVKDATQDLGTIYVLRSMAKVEVKLSEALSDGGYTLTSMTMKNLNACGYCLPYGATTLTQTEALSLETCFRPDGTATVGNQTVSGDGKSSWVMYVPEYKNVGADAPAVINVGLMHNGVPMELDPETGLIQFKGYDAGKPTGAAYNIVRNHNYVFEITGIKEESLVFRVTIDDLELGGRYGFEY